MRVFQAFKLNLSYQGKKKPCFLSRERENLTHPTHVRVLPISVEISIENENFSFEVATESFLWALLL